MSSEERSLADQPPQTPDPVSPFGPFVNPAGPNPPVEVASIVDTILELDEFLSGDVRRAEKSARFCTKPWLEADIDELDADLQPLIDSVGNPRPGSEESARDLSMRIQAIRVEMGQAFRTVRMGQLSSDDWKAFNTKHRAVLDKGAPYPVEFYDELIAVSALRPLIPVEKVRLLRSSVIRRSTSWPTRRGV